MLTDVKSYPERDEKGSETVEWRRGWKSNFDWVQQSMIAADYPMPQQMTPLRLKHGLGLAVYDSYGLPHASIEDTTPSKTRTGSSSL